MIQGHTFSALLRPGELPVELGRGHAFLHGLTAPAFLFGAGLAFGTATYADYARHHGAQTALHSRLRRYLALLALGYALQLPGGSLWAAFRAEGEQLALVCRVGPLQLVALVLCMVQMVAAVVPTPRRHALLSAALGLLVTLAAPHICRSDLPAMLGPLLGAFVADGSGAHFPVFPWAAFILFGVGSAGLRQQYRRLPGAYFIVAGVLVAALGYASYTAAAIQNDGSWWWRTSPSYLFFRLGIVFVIVGCLHVRRHGAGPRAAAGPAHLLARHSLVAYVAHLAILYGTPLTPGLVRSAGQSLNLLEAGLVCSLLVPAVAGAAWLWHWLEREQVLATRHKRAGLAFFCLTVLMR